MDQYREFLQIIDDLLKDETVNKMKKYNQHCDVNTYNHCKNVAYISYVICKKLNLDYISAARAGMLHDLFLYDWHDEREYEKLSDLHAFSHPRIALQNARKVTALNEIEEDMILKHMWPLTIILPKYKESYVITIADKYSALLETWHYCKKRVSRAIKGRSYGT